MKEIRYSDYFRDRMRFRRIPDDVPEQIFRNATERYFDMDTGRNIAIYRARVGRRRRVQMMLAYEEYADCVEFVTIHKINRREINIRITTGRWIPK